MSSEWNLPEHEKYGWLDGVVLLFDHVAVKSVGASW